MMLDIERAGIGWRLAKAGDEQAVADFAYDHMEEILTEVERLQAENHRMAQALRRLVELGEDDGSAADDAWKQAFGQAAMLIGRSHTDA